VHLEELLCRYQAQAVTPEERLRIEEHIATCGECRATALVFRQIDSVLREPAEPPAGWWRTEKNIFRALRWSGVAVGMLSVGAALQLVGGLVVLVLYAEKSPIIGGFGGASLISDSILFLALAIHVREESLRLQNATGSWERMRDEWGRLLEENVPLYRASIVANWIALLAGFVIAWSSFSSRKVPMVAGFVMVASALFGLWILPRNARRRKREREALRSFE
jgi:hypothetical protein